MEECGEQGGRNKRRSSPSPVSSSHCSVLGENGFEQNFDKATNRGKIDVFTVVSINTELRDVFMFLKSHFLEN